MVLEHAVITIRPGSADQFEQAMQSAQKVIRASPGFISLQLHRGVESPHR